ncbi:uncharacterized protein LOC116611873 [Nematostella vectensis]|uniref:uncharacterized protein LOC116611873 n=1 Tax=Nematostella vectensis TaxID=45351 RepID=UPI0020774EF9|nr:uncharacterized protein LOC116611873 [Nematostella vectensis]
MWASLASSTTAKQLTSYISQSETCTSKVLPAIVKKKVKDYESSEANSIRSIRTLYNGGLIGKRKYTTMRNSTDKLKEPEATEKTKLYTEFMDGCKVPKPVPYKKLMQIINNINIGEVTDLGSLAAKCSFPHVDGVYRPLKPFLLQLADMYITAHEKNRCLHWFKGEKGTFQVAIGEDGAPFVKDITATGTPMQSDRQIRGYLNGGHVATG